VVHPVSREFATVDADGILSLGPDRRRCAAARRGDPFLSRGFVRRLCEGSPVSDRDGDALAHAPLAEQVRALEAMVRGNPVARALMDRLPELGLPAWYLGAGGVAQTVWNHLHGFPATHGISDYDVVYFDPGDLSESGEAAVEARVVSLLGDDVAKLDVTNEARVHVWYERRFGRPLAPYRSVEHAIATWPTTATSIGIRTQAGEVAVCAPFGLADLFSMTVRANTALIDHPVYDAKATRWRGVWPRLTVLPWPEPREERCQGPADAAC
jgi:uncharacterized protein